MEIPFSISEFLIAQPKTVELDIADKLWKYHIIPMIPVRASLGFAIWASQRSGYRPEWWERNKGRSGNSQHCFNGLGAVDWTCTDFANNKDSLLNEMIEKTSYTRMTVYNTFIHADHKKTASGKREVYTSNSSSQWVFSCYAD